MYPCCDAMPATVKEAQKCHSHQQIGFTLGLLRYSALILVCLSQILPCEYFTHRSVSLCSLISQHSAFWRKKNYSHFDIRL